MSDRAVEVASQNVIAHEAAFIDGFATNTSSRQFCKIRAALTLARSLQPFPATRPFQLHPNHSLRKQRTCLQRPLRKSPPRPLSPLDAKSVLELNSFLPVTHIVLSTT